MDMPRSRVGVAVVTCPVCGTVHSAVGCHTDRECIAALRQQLAALTLRVEALEEREVELVVDNHLTDEQLDLIAAQMRKVDSDGTV